MINQIYENHFLVPSQSVEGKHYQVKKQLNTDVWTCTCPDFTNRINRNDENKKCKHIVSSQLFYYQSEKTISPEIGDQKICPNCYSRHLKKSGFRELNNGTKKQRFSCLNCKFRFILGGDGFHRMKSNPQTITESLNLVLCGVSYRDVARHFRETQNLRISHTSIQNWFRKYMTLIKEYVDSILPPHLSEVWSLDEMMLNVKNTKKTGKGFYDWLWSIIDPKTRFLIASEISKKRDINDAKIILKEGRKKTGTRPNYIVTDSLKSYTKAIKQEFGISTVAHIKTNSLTDGFQNRPIERFHNEFRAVIKSKRGLGNDSSAQEFADAYRVYHNFIRPHTGLPNNQTPAEASGIHLNLGKNKIRSLIEKSTEPEHKFAIQLGWRINETKVTNEGDCIRVTPKGWIDKKIWREINDILRLNKFCWLNNGKEKGSWIRLKQRSLLEYLQ